MYVHARRGQLDAALREEPRDRLAQLAANLPLFLRHGLDANLDDQLSAGEGVDAEIVDLRSLLPYDREAVLNSVGRTNRALLLHEATRTGVFAGELAALIAEEAFEELDAPVVRVTWDEVEELPETDRGGHGFGHSGV